jgi:hypothetical protein
LIAALALAALFVSQGASAQSPSEPIAVTPEKVREDDVQAKQAGYLAGGSHSDEPIAEQNNSSPATPAYSWGTTKTTKVSLANLAPFLLPYFTFTTPFLRNISWRRH